MPPPKMRRKSAGRAVSVDLAEPERSKISLFDSGWYKQMYSDIADSGIDSLQHFIRYGDEELRSPNPVFAPKWYRSTYLSNAASGVRRFHHYLEVGQKLGFSPNPAVDVGFVKKKYGLSSQSILSALLTNKEIDWIAPWFSRSAYRAANEDIRDTEFPEHHFSSHGYKEGRHLSRSSRFVDCDTADALSQMPFNRIVQEFTIGGHRYSIVNAEFPEPLSNEILEQATLDPDIVAFGKGALNELPKFLANDIDRRDLINHQALLRDIPPGSDIIIILPRLQIGGAEKYAAAIAKSFQSSRQKVTVVTTDSWRTDDHNALYSPLLNGFRGCHLGSIFDNLRRSWKPETVLSLLILRARPKAVFVINSDLGYRCIKQHGRSLSSSTRLYSVFFSEAPFGEGAPYSARYLRSIIARSTVVSDNSAAISKWQARVGKSFEGKFAKIAAPVKLRHPDQVRMLIDRRLERRQQDKPFRGLWIGRWEPFKATTILLEIALQCSFTIDVFGTSLPSQNTVPSNLRMQGELVSPEEATYEQYDLMIFTSFFEGMPNTVLECAAVGLPIVASDVGGIGETFGPDTVRLVNMNQDASHIARDFVREIDHLKSEKISVHGKRCQDLRRRVEEHHDVRSFDESIRSLLMDGDLVR